MDATAGASESLTRSRLNRQRHSLDNPVRLASDVAALPLHPLQTGAEASSLAERDQVRRLMVQRQIRCLTASCRVPMSRCCPGPCTKDQSIFISGLTRKVPRTAIPDSSWKTP